MKPLIRVLLFGIITWGLDAASKCWAFNHDQAFIFSPIPGLLDVLVPPVRNPGGSFGIPGTMKHFAIFLPALLSAASVCWMLQVERGQKPLTIWEQLGFGMLLGGTWSNLYDRFVQGAVTDFIHIGVFDFGMFNVADLLLTLGFVLVGIEALRLGRLNQYLFPLRHKRKMSEQAQN